LALANQAAMAAAGNSEEPRQDRAPQDRSNQEAGPGQRAERGDGRRERGGERGGRRNERRVEEDGAQQNLALDAQAAPQAREASDQLDNAAFTDRTEGNAPGAEEGNDQRSPRRSRDRYGRERRERGDVDNRESRAPQAASNDFQPSQPPAYAEANAAEFAPEFVANAAPAQAPVLTAPPAAAAVAQAPVAAPAPVPAPAAVTQATPAAAPVVAAIAAAPSAGKALPEIASYALPMQDLADVAQSSGLQWVNSNTAKIAEVAAAIAAEAKPVHVPRLRPVAVISGEGPLVLVETKRNLSAMALPTEDKTAV
jgi:ribonuclease E